MMGIGRWGNKSACPRWSAPELTPILKDVVIDNHAHYAANSRMVAAKSKERGTGRDIAAQTILGLLEQH